MRSLRPRILNHRKLKTTRSLKRSQPRWLLATTVGPGLSTTPKSTKPYGESGPSKSSRLLIAPEKPDARPRGDARGRDGGVRQELAAGVERRDFATAAHGRPLSHGITEALLYGISADVLVALLNIGLRSWVRSLCPAIITAMLRRTDTGWSRGIFHMRAGRSWGSTLKCTDGSCCRWLSGRASVGFLACLRWLFSLRRRQKTACPPSGRLVGSRSIFYRRRR